ncbi:GatB/YqeY domain-containing protein [Spirosoma knui]
MAIHLLTIMALKQQIDADIKQAMLAKDQDRLRALRAIKSMILLEETKEGAHGELKPEDETKILTKAVKQRKDSADIYRQQGREDLLKTEEVEISIIENYLPKQLSEDELREKLQAIIAQVGASAPSDMGKVMGVATKELAGQADGKAISTMVKQLLQ